MSFTYTSNIPISGQTLNVTKNPINSNFQAINQIIAVNHIGFNKTNLGKHTIVEMQARAAGSGGKFTGTGSEGTLYARTVSGASQLMYSPDATGTQYQMTVTDDALKATFGASGIGWTFLPGGIIYNYGFLSTPNSSPSSGTIDFSKPYTDINSINIFGTYFFTGTTPTGSDTWITKFDNLALDSFKWYDIGNSSHVDGFSWFAIGK